jgi:hypothetical protein
LLRAAAELIVELGRGEVSTRAVEVTSPAGEAWRQEVARLAAPLIGPA